MMLKQIKERVTQFKRDERGASAIEYAVIAAIIVVAIIAGLNLLDIKGIFSGINSSISTTASGA